MASLVRRPPIVPCSGVVEMRGQMVIRLCVQYHEYTPLNSFQPTGIYHRFDLFHTNCNAPSHTNTPRERVSSLPEDEIARRISQEPMGMLSPTFSGVGIFTRMAMILDTRGASFFNLDGIHHRYSPTTSSLLSHPLCRGKNQHSLSLNNLSEGSPTCALSATGQE